MLNGFWCPDAAAAAAACLAKRAEDAARCLSIADDVCAHRFTFRDHWEMERTNVPVEFGPDEKEIDWAHIPAGDPEWLYAMNRHTGFVNLGKAWRYTGDDRYAEKFARLIEDWIDRVPRTEENSGSTWRSLEAGLRCENWLRALGLFAGSSALTPALQAKIEACLAAHGEYLCRSHGLFQELSNWGVLQDHGLFLVGSYLGRADWCALALKRLDETLHRSVLRDGSQWEQSPMYHCEVLHCALNTVLVARGRGAAVPARLAENTHRMCTALAAWLTPAGRLVCQSDSDDLDARDLLVTGAVLFADGALRAAAGGDFFEENYWDLGPEAEPAYRAMPPVRPALASTALPDSGNYLLRTGFGPDAGYLHFHCGFLGSGHGHADLLHLGAGICGEDVLIDSGRYTYVDSPIRAQLKSPAAHNTTRVDGQDFTRYQDSWAYSSAAWPLKGEHCFTPAADTVYGMHLGYLERGVVTGRRVVYLKALNAALVCDEFYTADSDRHTYEANFHFGPGECRLENGCLTWQGQRAGAVLQSLDGPDGATCHLGRAPYSRQYNRLEEGDLLTVQADGCGFFSMLHLLSMDAGAPQPVTAQRIPVFRASGGDVLPRAVAEAVRIEKGGQSAVVLLCHAELAHSVEQLRAGEYHGWGRVLVFTPECPEGLCLAW